MNYKKAALYLLSLSASTLSFSMDNFRDKVLSKQNDPQYISIKQFHDYCERGNKEKIVSLLKENNSLLNATSCIGETGLHVACRWGRVDVVEELLTHKNIKVNITDMDGCTPFHRACDSGNPKIAIPLLTRDDIDVNNKNNDGNIPLFCATLPIINHLIASGKIKNIYKKNALKQTFFYVHSIGDNTLDIENDRFINRLTFPNKDYHMEEGINIFTIIDKERFINEQLYCAATMHSTTDIPHRSSYKKKETAINPFIQLCVKHGANLNRRNLDGKRAVDLAEEQYIYAIKNICPQSRPFNTKEIIFHSFLQETPYISDAKLFYIIKNSVLINLIMDQQYDHDIWRKIMGYYSALTIDRAVALQDLRVQFYGKSILKKKNYKKTLLAEKCKNLGYINPNQPLQLTY